MRDSKPRPNSETNVFDRIVRRITGKLRDNDEGFGATGYNSTRYGVRWLAIDLD